MIFCLKDADHSCKEIRKPVESMHQCMLQGQTQAEQWLANHLEEGYYLDHWKCALTS
jgi:hypothetical protein